MKRINGIFISLIGMLALSMSLMAQDVATVTDGCRKQTTRTFSPRWRLSLPEYR